MQAIADVLSLIVAARPANMSGSGGEQATAGLAFADLLQETAAGQPAEEEQQELSGPGPSDQQQLMQLLACLLGQQPTDLNQSAPVAPEQEPPAAAAPVPDISLWHPAAAPGDQSAADGASLSPVADQVSPEGLPDPAEPDHSTVMADPDGHTDRVPPAAQGSRSALSNRLAADNARSAASAAVQLSGQPIDPEQTVSPPAESAGQPANGSDRARMETARAADSDRSPVAAQASRVTAAQTADVNAPEVQAEPPAVGQAVPDVATEQSAAAGQTSAGSAAAQTAVSIKLLPWIVRPLPLNRTVADGRPASPGAAEAGVDPPEAAPQPAATAAGQADSLPLDANLPLDVPRSVDPSAASEQADDKSVVFQPSPAKSVPVMREKAVAGADSQPAERWSGPQFGLQPALRPAAEATPVIEFTAGPGRELRDQLWSAVETGIRQLRVAAREGEEITVKMQLYPRDLGEVRVNVKFTGDAVTAHFEAVRPEAVQAIKENLATLKSALDGQGWSQVSLAADSFGGGLAQDADRRFQRSPWREARGAVPGQRLLPLAEEVVPNSTSPIVSRVDYRL